MRYLLQSFSSMVRAILFPKKWTLMCIRSSIATHRQFCEIRSQILKLYTIFQYVYVLKVCCWKHLFWIDLRPIVHTNNLFYIKIKRTGRIFMFYQAISEMWRMIFIILIQILHTVFRSKYKITRVFWLKPS